MTRQIFFMCVFIITALAGGAWASELSSLDLDIHGFVSQGYLKSEGNNFLTADTNDGSFQFNEVGINLNKRLTDSLHVGVQLLARDQGVIGNNEVEIDWAYGNYRWRDWLGVRAGIMRIPLGLYNETRDLDFLRTSILLPQSVYNENLRDYFSRIRGIGLYGDIPMNNVGSLGYQLMVGTVDIDPDGGVARSSETSGVMEFVDSDVGTVYNGSLQWHTPLDGLSTGITYFYNSDAEARANLTIPQDSGMPSGVGQEPDISTGPDTAGPDAPSDMPPGSEMPPGIGQDSGMPRRLGQPSSVEIPSEMTVIDELDEFEVYVLSAEYTWNDLVIAAEYMKMNRKSHLKGFPMEFELDMVGYYLSAAYRFTDWFELGSYYSIYYGDEDDKDGDDLEARGKPDYRAWLKDFTVTTRFDINPYWNFKLEGHLMDGAALVMAQDNPDGFDEHWYLLAAKVSFYF